MGPAIVIPIILAPVLLVFLSFILYSMRCAHSWQLVDKTEFPPPIIALRENIGHPNYIDSELQDMCRRTVVLALRCERCGHARILKERA